MMKLCLQTVLFAFSLLAISCKGAGPQSLTPREFLNNTIVSKDQYIQDSLLIPFSAESHSTGIAGHGLCGIVSTAAK